MDEVRRRLQAAERQLTDSLIEVGTALGLLDAAAEDHCTCCPLGPDGHPDLVVETAHPAEVAAARTRRRAWLVLACVAFAAWLAVLLWVVTL